MPAGLDCQANTRMESFCSSSSKEGGYRGKAGVGVNPVGTHVGQEDFEENDTTCYMHCWLKGEGYIFIIKDARGVFKISY